VSLETALAELYARVPRGMRLNEASLAAMREACARAGHPERAFAAVHVAGTNGKGSVCAMVESIARAAGERTGLYTSPHLCRFAERIRIDGEPVTDAALEAALAQAIALGPDLSFFETATLAAFLALRDAKVELAVLEVGIGGRLDATNVIPPPRAAAITRIALDHMEMLGGTLAEIAREKAGIAKPGMSIVVGAADSEVRAAIEETARAAGATTRDAGGADAKALLGRVAELGLRGDHQWENATVAYRLARDLGFGDAAIERGLREVRWPGRLEWIDGYDGAYLLDGAHNPDGAAALARYLAEQSSRLALVFGALADKAWPEMLDLLAPVTPHRVYVEPHGRAAASPRDLALRHPGEAAAGLAAAMSCARNLVGTGGIVVIAGSLYLVGEARALLLGLPRDPPVAM
jgi:dihydrofolate synthase/folylpolyglutamate synthase